MGFEELETFSTVSTTAFWLTVIFEIIVLICFFVLCANVGSIKKKLLPYGSKQSSAFALYIAMGEKEKAKAILFEMLLADEKLQGALNTNVASVELEMRKYNAMLNKLELEFDANKAFATKKLFAE